MPSVSCTVAQQYSELKIARAIASIAASTYLRVLASPAADLQHRPVRLINRHSEHAGRIGPLRGFLPRGLFNACPHALSLTHEFVVEGRRRTNLNGSSREGTEDPTAEMGRECALTTGRLPESERQWPLAGGEFGEPTAASRPTSAVRSSRKRPSKSVGQ